MILDQITLHNFGLYAERQTINLTPPTPDKPVILFGGLNGGGKTTLLDALQLCLFGPHARISNRGTLPYQEYLARCIHRSAHPAEAAIELSFRHTVEGQEDHYRLLRSWRKANGGCKEYFEVLKNGRPESVLSDNWSSQVEDFIPINIAHLFLFDGEQIERYASQEDSAGLISAAIQSLLGLDMVDQLQKDLVTYERRKRVDDKDVADQVQIATARAEIKELQQRVQSIDQQRAAILTHQIDRKRAALASADERFRKLGGELYEERAQIERRLAEASQAVMSTVNGLRELAGGGLPLHLVRGLLNAIGVRDRREEDGRRAYEVVETLKTRDETVLTQLRACLTDKRILATLSTFLQADRAERASQANEQRILDLGPEVRGDLHALTGGGLDELVVRAKDQLGCLQRAQAKAERLRLEHENIPGSDTISEAAAERDSIKEELTVLTEQHRRMGEEVSRLKSEIERKEQQLARLLESEAAERAEREDRARILRHSEKVRRTLSAFRDAVIQRNVRRIEQFVLESYHQLLRKECLVSRLVIDSTTFALTLYGRDGSVLSSERLSAGERQLLAIALLWGLAKASGRPLPTAIDTPLGRLDSGHRMNLVERYLPFASHQVLLLSTDEEIAGEYLERLRPWVGRTYQLDYDDASGQTHVSPGYFRAQEAA
jgi:DNA sulfur modification protein DndD